MKLTTTVPINTLLDSIDYQSKVLLLGSCFTENIGKKLAYFGFNVLVNPFGIIFNSTSLKLLVERAVENQAFTLDDCTSHFSYLVHSDLNNTDPEELLENLNTGLEKLQYALKNSSHLYITLGTAWVYRHIEKNIVVANCHKQPQHLFEKELLPTHEITLNLEEISELIKSINPTISITYTLSPVRHIKDGFIENQRSKSRLHEAIQSQVDQNIAQYFPAYEITMDELRDYRFYARDMIHLNDIGIDFIWSRFRESGINPNTLPQQKAIEKYRKLSLHRATDTIAHGTQLKQMREKLRHTFPEINL
jgi:hypothetical protein